MEAIMMNQNQRKIYNFSLVMLRGDAESIVSLDSAGRSKLVKTALSNLREDNRQRVLPLLHLHLRELDHFQTVRRELIAEKLVHQKHLANNINKVEDFAGKKLKEVERVLTPIILDVGHDSRNFL